MMDEEDCKTVDDWLEWASQTFESANWHDCCHMPHDCWDEIKKFIPPEKRKAAAKALAQALVSGV